MKNRILTLGASMLALPGIAQAHTHLEMAIPADNSVLASPPSKIVLHFSEAARLTALSIQKDADKEAKAISPRPKEAKEELNARDR